MKKKKKARVVLKAKAFEKKLHSFLDIWKEHIKDEIKVHAKLLRGRESLSQHVKETIRLHRGFLQKMEKLV